MMTGRMGRMFATMLGAFATMLGAVATMLGAVAGAIGRFGGLPNARFEDSVLGRQRRKHYMDAKKKAVWRSMAKGPAGSTGSPLMPFSRVPSLTARERGAKRRQHLLDVLKGSRA